MTADQSPVPPPAYRSTQSDQGVEVTYAERILSERRTTVQVLESEDKVILAIDRSRSLYSASRAVLSAEDAEHLGALLLRIAWRVRLASMKAEIDRCLGRPWRQPAA